MRRDEAVVALKSEEAVLRDLGLSRLAVFGSTARDEAGAESDLDLLIDVDWSRKFSLIDLVGVQQYLEDRLGCKVDFAFESKLRPEMKARVLRDAVAIF